MVTQQLSSNRRYVLLLLITTMNLVAWFLQNFIQPFFWSALQWVWSFNPNFEQAELPIQFYSYSATSLLLWFYEKLPHSVVLTIFGIGCLTVCCISVALVCCFGQVMWILMKLCFRTLFPRVVRGYYRLFTWLVRRTIILIVFLCYQAVKLVLFFRSLCNSSSGIAPTVPIPRAINDNITARQLGNIEVIDAAAFRPRRRRTRSNRSPRG